MAKLFQRRENYGFSNRVHPKKGVISFLLSIILLMAYLALFIAASKGHGGILSGLAGIFIFGGAIVGFSLAMISMKEEDIHYRFPFLGAFMNGILILIGVALYFAGMATTLR